LLGVPLARLIRDYDLDITGPGLAPLVRYCSSLKLPGNDDETITDSLFPSWISNNNKVQVMPAGWYYVGHFPLGNWHKDEDD